MVIVFLIGLLGYIKGGIIEDYPVSKFFLWLFPPVYDVLLKLTNKEYFSLSVIANAAALTVGYSLILLTIQMYMLKKNKF